MAKKYSRQSSLKITIDKILSRLYHLGFLHSFVWHLVLLLWLALLYPVLQQKTDRLSPISISFTNVSETIDPDTESFPPIEETINIVDQSDDQASSTMVADHTTSIAEHQENNLHLDIQSLDLQIPEQIQENHSSDNIAQEIKGLIPEKRETEEPTHSAKTRSKTKKRSSSVLGLPESLLQEGDDNSTQLIQNPSNKADAGEIGRRLKEYGAQTGDVQISLAWDTIDDLDLHVIVQPLNSHINWMNRNSYCGGMLDIDMNFHPNLLNNKPIENIFWAHGAAPHAEYIVGVHYYASWSGMREVRGTLLVKVDGKTQSFPVVATFGQPLTPITSFRR